MSAVSGSLGQLDLLQLAQDAGHPVAIGDRGYRTDPSFCVPISIDQFRRLSPYWQLIAKDFSSIRTRIENRIQEAKVFLACSQILRSPDPLFQADVVSACLLLSEFKHLLVHHWQS
jgi:hypothetical protein